MNEQLKFSWGHIIAFLALIIISYFSFVGVTYLTDGDFTKASIAMVAIDIVIFIFFIGAQMMKATERKFARRIWVERFFIFGSPIIFIIAMLPYFHFWTVNSQDEVIVSNFTNAISASKQMFKDYDNYSSERIGNYSHMLDRVISNKSIHPEEFIECGFSQGEESIQKENMVMTLRLQLLSENYDSLKNEAIKWINASNVGASTFNVFLLGNTKEIKNAIHEWNKQLVEFSNPKLQNEEFNGYNEVIGFDMRSESLTSVDEGLDGLTAMFTRRGSPELISIITAILLYFALLFPYFLQDRHTKSQQRLIGMERGTISLPKTGKNKGESFSGEIKIDNYEDDKPQKTSSNHQDDDDDYTPFTL